MSVCEPSYMSCPKFCDLSIVSCGVCDARDCPKYKRLTFNKIREAHGLDPIKPDYYNDSKITPFDVIDDWNLDFYLGNAVKYIKRAGKKKDNSRLQDLKKIREYVDQEIRKEEASV